MKKQTQRKIIAVTNQKGGVGKTTSTINIGAGLKDLGLRVLLVDLDAQPYLTHALGIEAEHLQYTVYDLLTSDANFENVLIEKNGLSLIPSAVQLAEIESSFNNKTDKLNLLKNALSKISDYDFVLLDCPPNLGLLTLNALTAATEVLVPLQAEFFSIRGLNSINDIVEKIKQQNNSDIKIGGLILTQYDQRLRLHNQVKENLKKYFGHQLFNTCIRRNVALAEATSFGQSIFEYDPRSHGAEDYLALCHEILNRE